MALGSPLHRQAFVAASLLAGWGLCGPAHAQFTSGTIFGTGLGVTLSASTAVQDSNWKIVAVPTGFTPPNSQTTPYQAYVPYTAVPGAFVGGGSPQTGLVYLGGTNYWIAPQPTTSSLVPGTYNWIAQQQFYVPVSGFYKFDFPGAGDNELEFYIDGSVSTADPLRPTITGGQLIGGRAGTFVTMSQFTGGAQLTSGTHTASMVLWDYGGETGAIIGSSTFAPAVAYWATGTAAGGNGTWNNTNANWTSDVAGVTTKQAWTNSAGYAYFGGTSGTVSVTASVNVIKTIFTTGGYQITNGGGELAYNSIGAQIVAQTGTSTISATQTAPGGLKVSGNGTVVLQGTTNLGWTQQLVVDGSKLVMNGTVNSPIGNGFVNVSGGSLSGTGTINNAFGGSGLVTPGPSGTNSGILTATQLDPTGGIDFQFVFSGTAPTYGSAGNSVNDVMRLTGGTPFSSAMGGSNSMFVFLNFTEAALTPGTTIKGGFYTDVQSDFTSLLNVDYVTGGYQVYVLGDGAGTDYVLNGVGYYNWRTLFGWDQSIFVSTVPETANFGSGNVNGQVMLLSVAVPEPSGYVLAAAGLACGGYSLSRRRKRG